MTAHLGEHRYGFGIHPVPIRFRLSNFRLHVRGDQLRFSLRVFGTLYGLVIGGQREFLEFNGTVAAVPAGAPGLRRPVTM